MLNNTILIGTCRIKRMLAFVDDKKIKERIKQVSTHTHYVAEIHQLISYLQGKDIPNELLGLVIDDINVGKLNSYQEIEKWREETKNYLKQADKVIIEVSSLKKFILSNEPLYFGNITAIGSVIGGKDRLADFIQKEMLRKKFSSLKPALSEEEEIIVLMKKIKRLLPNKKILWMSHFRYFIESREEEIAERKKLNSWIQKGAKLLGDDYFDQTIIVDELGANSALKDSSHYSEEAEKLMAKVISLWIKKDKIYASSSEGSYFSLLNKEINKKEKKDKIVKQIKKYTKDKNHKKVIELYTLLIEQEPNNIKYYYSIIGQALLLNDFDTAMNYLSIFEKIGSNEALFHISKGRVHYKKREYDEARKAFINLLDNERYAEMAYETIASTYLTEKNTDQLANFIDNYHVFRLLM